MGPSISQPPPAHTARCIVLTPKGVQVDAELTGALTRPDLELVRCDSELVALGELCRVARHNTENSRGGGLILLLVEPRRIEMAAALVRATERYAPRAACWMFDPTQSPRLRAVQPADVETWMHAESEPEEADERPPLKLAEGIEPKMQTAKGAAPVQNPPLVVMNRKARESTGPGELRQSAQDSEAGGILTTEELTMLLADDDEPKHN